MTKHGQKPPRTWLPWYVILRRVVFVGPYILGLLISYVALLCMHGKAEADHFMTQST